MTAPYLVPCLVTLRAEFSALSPHRDKGADGWIGDAAHLSRDSDHNPDSQGRVLAIDIDSTGPWPVPFSDLVESLRGDDRLEYIIFNRRIASRSRGWTWRTYTGSNDPHTGHAHFSARHDHAGNNSTAPWGLEDLVTISSDDIKKIWTTDNIIQAPNNAASKASNPYWAPASFLTDQSWYARLNYALLKGIADKVQAPLDLSADDTAAIVSGLLAGLPADLAKQIAERTLDEVAARLSGEVQQDQAS